MYCRGCGNDTEGKTVCKCGYVFEGPQTDSVAVLSAIDRSVRTIKNVVLWWAILTIAGAVAWLLYVTLR